MKVTHEYLSMFEDDALDVVNKNLLIPVEDVVFVRYNSRIHNVFDRFNNQFERNSSKND